MPKEEEHKPNQYCFQVGNLNVDQAEEGKKKRTFSGVAYSGEVITDHWYWDRIVFDLDSMQIKGRIPALLDHSTRQRAGAINSHSIDHQNGLTVSGDLMSNEFGTQVAQDSDDGFPWQMSVRIEPSAVEEIQAGASVTVNGKVHQGPITVFRGGRIREVSFCALGADDNTNAVAASHSPKNFNQPEDTNVTELEQAKAEAKALQDQVDALTEQNKQFAAAKREAEISALGKDLGKEFSAEDVEEMKKLDDSAFAFSAKQLRQFSANNTQPPTGQQQQQAPSVNPAFAHLFSHQANPGQGGQAPQGSALDQAFNQFMAAQQQGAKS
ncbi:hypothetical protein F906_01517 [Acinetobacter pseudolwoffii]|uniref:HK97 family phage prohead protease n=1 Tax=Acinetobacter pseudolwoffii TaxID=2053287 RepID=N9KQZ2_9GAMM|nr:hypothetical protein [Acinetobacter pseudolwoffii]ENW86462.1 hypothetical protein F906_01517 [Acinetobacter pseudolwoffii]